MTSTTASFDAPLLDLRRWDRPADAVERALLHTVRGPVLDVGCGPGRLVALLCDRGILALGIDAAPLAIRRAHARGAAVIARSVYDLVPGEGEWATVLLVDGNIGIGGDPERLLRRVRALLAPDGRAVVEVEPPGAARRDGVVRLEVATEMVGLFPWSWVGADDIARLSAAAGFSHCSREEIAGRWFARLAR